LLNPTTILPTVSDLSVAIATAGEEERSAVHLRQEPPDIIQEQPLKWRTVSHTTNAVSNGSVAPTIRKMRLQLNLVDVASITVNAAT
jgi:hypothetical protein